MLGFSLSRISFVAANATIGDHRMRVVAIPYYYTPEPEGYSYYGECEDYTITVAADPARPIMEIDKTLIDQQVNGENASADITVSNNGGGTLEANVACYYVLPDAPTSNYNLGGMKISSVDVFIGDLPTDETSIVIYGQKSQAECGDIITEQVFTPTEHSWNHVVLDNPVEISDKDIWVGVKMDGLTETTSLVLTTDRL